MLWSNNALRGWHLRATDGSLGEVGDFLFDDRSWAVRYLVADTSRWLPSRTVLIAPEALGRPEEGPRHLPVGLTVRRIKDSPPIATHQPVSVQMEQRMRAYYGWQPYFGGHSYGGSGRDVAIGPPPPGDGDEQDAHLRSMRSIEGYTVKALDGTAGIVKDFQFDDEGWIIRYVAVDTGGWITGKPVVVAPAWIRDISWLDREVVLDPTTDAIMRSPDYDAAQRIARDYEQRLYGHYGRPPYWRG